MLSVGEVGLGRRGGIVLWFRTVEFVLAYETKGLNRFLTGVMLILEP